jgi:hypothetical protein
MKRNFEIIQSLVIFCMLHETRNLGSTAATEQRSARPLLWSLVCELESK